MGKTFSFRSIVLTPKRSVLPFGRSLVARSLLIMSWHMFRSIGVGYLLSGWYCHFFLFYSNFSGRRY